MYSSSYLPALRAAMKRDRLWALVVPTTDPHNSEYVPRAYAYRAALSNFFGSAGTAVVTADEALMWTDGRYHLEASSSLAANWKLMRDGNVGVPTYEEWLERHANGGIVGHDAFHATISTWERLASRVRLMHSTIAGDVFHETVPLEENVKPVYEHPAEFCGATTREKAEQTLLDAEAAGCDGIILSALDDIAWITNLRGEDISFNPVFVSYAYIEWSQTDNQHKREPRVHVFVDLRKIPSSLRTRIERKSPISFYNYDSFASFLHNTCTGRRVAIDVQQTSYQVLQMLTEAGAVPRREKGFVAHAKSVKNSVELAGARACHVRDGCALVRYLASIEDDVVSRKREDITELVGSTRLEEFRQEEAFFIHPSFETISSSGPNGAVVHYSPTKESARTILTTDEIYLVDSGGQYLDGTTDVTRCVALSECPPQHIREAYTAVLKGHLALRAVVFPRGVAGYRLDCLARTHLWSLGLDYAHGTSHGVGSFLHVHEGPQSIPARLPPSSVALKEGMIMSNEPGFYKDGEYGLRIENVVEVVKVETVHNNGSCLGFRDLTMCPYDRRLIDKEMLTAQEKTQVNDYHSEVRRQLLPLLRERQDDLAIQYLLRHTENI